MSRLYVAGPMTGLPEFNYPAFRAAAERLRALGHQVEDPSTNMNPTPDDKPLQPSMFGDWEGGAA